MKSKYFGDKGNIVPFELPLSTTHLFLNTGLSDDIKEPDPY